MDLILRNGEPVSFDATLADGDRVSVYPWIRSVDQPSDALRPPFPTPPRFVCDVHLGTLARRLRMLGLDTRYQNEADDLSPFRRCTDCNGQLAPTELEDVRDRVPPAVQERYDAFRQCADCGTVCWNGTHVDRMQARLNEVLDDLLFD